ncbi:hypothetical protein HYW67_02280 [Candidatus Parcubacteria bacterium]|nr:hypothetical protein [Candidatus Parcubacteria bacterium]
MKAVRVVFLVVLVLAAIFALDRALVARQNLKVVDVGQQFARWPTGTLAWVQYMRVGGEEFASFFDAARFRLASAHFKRTADGVWKQCRRVWDPASCTEVPPPLQVEAFWAFVDGRALLAEAAKKG